MDLQINNIMLQMLMVLFPIIFYQATMNNRKQKKKDSFYWGIVFTVTMGLCLAFPIKIDDGIILDLRMVPWYLSFIYGGKAVGIFVTSFYIIIRFLVGGFGVIPASIVLVLGTVIIWRFGNTYMNFERKDKILLSVFFLIVLSSLIPTIGTFLTGRSLSMSRFLINIGFVIANGVTVWLAVHLLESHREKRELIKEIQKNEKLQVVGQVAASVAHEIRNPMTSVRGFIQLLSDSKNISAGEKEHLYLCLDELDRANAIISDYLSLGKVTDADQHGLIDVSNLAAKSVNTLISYAMMNNVSLTLEKGSSLHILGNSSRFQQLLVNLIKNAIEAARPDGNVKVTVSTTVDSVEIAVQDDGQGMTPQQMENIGLPYYSTKEKGTGLGLMVTLQIVKEMNGFWDVKSQLNKGTIFKVFFPLTNNK